MVQQTFSKPKNPEVPPVLNNGQDSQIQPTPPSIPQCILDSAVPRRPVSYWRSPLSIVRVLIVFLGGISLCIGVYSHFQSDWTKLDVIISVNGTSGKLYKVMCDSIKESNDEDVICPSIFLERYYVLVAVITYIISVIGLFASIMIGLGSLPFRILDFIYHNVATFALILAGSLLIISAVQIGNLSIQVEGMEVQLLKGAKIIAGTLTVIEAFLCSAVPYLIVKYG